MLSCSVIRLCNIFFTASASVSITMTGSSTPPTSNNIEGPQYLYGIIGYLLFWLLDSLIDLSKGGCLAQPEEAAFAVVCFEGGGSTTCHTSSSPIQSVLDLEAPPTSFLSRATRAEASGSMREPSLYLFLFILGACIVMYHR
jgi:hypothetical protein